MCALQWTESLYGMCRFVCDELDGRFARMLNQSTMLGTVLDMVTDRCADAPVMPCSRP